MKGNKYKIGSLFFTLLFTALAIYYLAPSFSFYGKSIEEQQAAVNENPEIKKNLLNLGLDLQGGMRLVLEVDRSEVPKEGQKDLLDRAYTIIENRINSMGLAEPVIQKQGESRIIVELPGYNNETSARELMNTEAKLYFHLLADGDVIQKMLVAVDEAFKAIEVKVDSTKIEEKADTIKTLDLLAGNDAPVDENADNVKSLDLVAGSEVEAGKESINSFSTYLRQDGRDFIVKIQDTAKVNKIFTDSKVAKVLKGRFSSYTFQWGYGTVQDGKFRKLYIMRRRPERVDGENIVKATNGMSQDGGGYEVNIEFNAKGANQFSKLTGRNIGKRLAIVLNNTIYSAPSLNVKISRGRAVISGDFDMESSKQLAVVLQAGALPAPVNIMSESKIGPSLGKESIEKAKLAAILGFGLVVIFIILYYKGAGVITTVALALNVVFILAIMASFGATLTLPGIAGIILIMGMSVDANVIIFERIKEELALGNGVRTAIDVGYAHASSAIMDANITTLFTAVVLYNIGSGPIKGFAVTLIAGILVSLFTSLTFTKMVFNLFTASGKVKKLSI